PEVTREVRSRVPLVIKAFPAGDPGLDHVDDYGADAVLIDSPRPGSGQVFDWSLAEGRPDGHRVILAGGLTPENVADAIRRVGPWGVDVASGVEADRGEPGQKDARKVKAFVEAARAARPPQEPRAADDLDGFGPYDWMEDEAL
ncbi:MAG: phosphoribosylanthranilate isomerase, partial [Actinobacteria bacterium]|nr:phosphoribosylanthranilate isomerase [Actinomycetota bacterium]